MKGKPITRVDARGIISGFQTIRFFEICIYITSFLSQEIYGADLNHLNNFDRDHTRIIPMKFDP
jgi:hypothetical protein